MKKKLFLISAILLTLTLVFAGCGSKDDTSGTADKKVSPEEAVFDGFGFSSAKLLLDAVNEKLSPSGISFGEFVQNLTAQNEEGYELYFESESSVQISLSLRRTSYGAEELVITYDTGKKTENAQANFDAVIKAVSSVFEGSEIAASELESGKTEAGSGKTSSDYESAKYLYYLNKDEAGEYKLQTAPASNRDLK